MVENGGFVLSIRSENDFAASTGGGGGGVDADP
jgi:hypothetical protein